MAAPAAPAAGAGIEAIAGLLAIVACLVCLGLGRAWAATIGWLFTSLAGQLRRVSIHTRLIDWEPFGPVADFLESLDRNVREALNYAALKSEKGAVWLFAQAWHQLRWLGREIGDLADTVAHAFDRTIRVDVPHAVRAALAPTLRAVHGIDRKLGRLEALEHALAKRLQHGIDRLDRAVTKTLPHAIAHVGARVGITARQIRRLARRVARAERHLGVAAMTAAVAIALGRLGLRWIRCPALGRIGRRIGCGGFGVLEEFLAVTFEALLVLDLCRYALAAQRLARLVVPQLGAVLLVKNAVCLGGGASYPTAHDSPPTLTKITPPSAHD